MLAMLAVLLAVAIISYLYVYKGVEGFVAPSPGANNATKKPAANANKAVANTVVPQTTNFVENVVDGVFPKPDKVVFYLTAFSDLTNYGQKTYEPASQKWLNYTPNVAPVNCVGEPTKNYFQAIGVAPTAKLTSATGFPTKNVSLRGPSSFEFDISSGRTVNTFTFGIYATINTLDILEGKPAKIFELFVESPNYLCFSITAVPNNATVVNFKADIGQQSYTWQITKAAILMKKALYAISYDTVNVRLRAAGNNYTKPVGEASVKVPMVLGTTPAEINAGMNLDASILAFVYYNVALSADEVTNLETHLLSESTGYTRIVDSYKAVAEATATKAAVQTLNQAGQIVTLQKQLDACKKAAVAGGAGATTPGLDLQWQIDLKSAIAAAGDADLAKCGLLALNKFGSGTSAGAVSAAIASTATTVGATAPATTATAAAATPVTDSRFTINYPWDASSANAMTGTATVAPPVTLSKTPPSIWTTGAETDTTGSTWIASKPKELNQANIPKTTTPAPKTPTTTTATAPEPKPVTNSFGGFLKSFFGISA